MLRTLPRLAASQLRSEHQSPDLILAAHAAILWAKPQPMVDTTLNFHSPVDLAETLPAVTPESLVDRKRKNGTDRASRRAICAVKCQGMTGAHT